MVFGKLFLKFRDRSLPSTKIPNACYLCKNDSFLNADDCADSVMHELITPPEKRPTLDSSLPRLSSSEEIAAASRTPAQTFCRTIPVLLFQLVGGFFCDNFRLIIIHVVERQFRPGCNRFGREEGEVVDIDVGVVVGDCVDGTVGITGVVDEPGWPP